MSGDQPSLPDKGSDERIKIEAPIAETLSALLKTPPPEREDAADDPKRRKKRPPP